MDKASSQMIDDIIEKCSGYLKEVLILHAGCTSILQPIDISINKPLKNSLKKNILDIYIEKK